MAYTVHVDVTAPGTARLVLAGSVIMVRHDEVLAQLDLALKAEPSREILIDLSEVTALDSSGIALLLLVRRRARRSGRDFRVSGAQPEVMRHLYLAGVTLLLGLRPPVDDDRPVAEGRPVVALEDAGTVDVLDEPFELDTIRLIRARLSRYAAGSGISEPDQYKLLLAASEIMANAVQHGGGSGRIKVTRSGDRVFIEISDNGRGIARRHLAGSPPPRLGRITPHGLWMTRRICERVDIDTGPGGTTVRLTVVVSTDG